MKGLFFCLFLATTLAKSTPNPFNHAQTHKPRKLVFAPYVNLSQDFSARDPGDEGKIDAPMNNPALGPFQDAPVPAFGLGGMMPNSLGMTNQPYNYMYGSAMMHPMNPMHPMNQMGGPAPGLQSQGFGPDNTPTNGNDENYDLNDFNEMGDDIKLNDKFDPTRKLGLFADDELLNPSDGIISQCRDTQKQAIQISNAIMRKQNKVIYEEIMKYLLKSKYLIAMTEIKLVRVLRKKIYGLMKDYSNITEDKIDVVRMQPDRETAEDPGSELDEQYGGDSNGEFNVEEPNMDEEMPNF